ncbi:DUF308 domain-containing protein [Pseudobutyrivibrio sp.]|uniref:DUF308 domain-containing protein n=1 Tax=Pseudobutyrivibrio sp. TaxID=2014367 RepID=UPI001DD0794A|nr:DUF308 domain-containing protein [Pseudobutyrivibrio sp.]MBE5911504.1 hypothetical protein [Pseudobutyrivibrio sp.]
MKEKIKGLKINITASAIISIIIGLLLVTYPDEITIALSRVIACIIIVAGVAIVLSQIFENDKNALGIAVGGILSLLGVWMLLAPEDNIIINIIPIAIGVILVVHGVQDLTMAVEIVRNKGKNSWVVFLGAIINIVLGALCIAMAFQVVKMIFWLIGVMLIYDGITDLFFVHKVKVSKVVVDSIITREEDI